jgi:hypothetical protein
LQWNLNMDGHKLKIIKKTDMLVVAKLSDRDNAKVYIPSFKGTVVKIRTTGKDADATSMLYIKSPRNVIKYIHKIEQQCVSLLHAQGQKTDDHNSAFVMDVHHGMLLKLKASLDTTQSTIQEAGTYEFRLRIFGIRAQKNVSSLIWELVTIHPAVEPDVPECHLQSDDEFDEDDEDNCAGPLEEDRMDMVEDVVTRTTHCIGDFQEAIHQLKQKVERLEVISSEARAGASYKALADFIEEIDSMRV